MDLLTIVIVLMVVIVVIGLIKAQNRPESLQADVEASSPYIKRHNVFSVAERIFYRALKSAVGHQYEIFVQVRVADLLDVQKGMSRSDHEKYMNKIKSKRIDFVLCDPLDLKVICAIELDDSDLHEFATVQIDQFLHASFEKAGLALLHCKARHTYSDQDIIALLQTKLPVTIAASELSRSVERIDVHNALPSTAIQAALNAARAMPGYKNQCPQCDSDMSRKKVSQGTKMGEIYWCCTKYPACNTVLPISGESSA